MEIREVRPDPQIQAAMTRLLTADRVKRSMITESEGERQSMINSSEGKMKAEILFAEGSI